MTDQQSGPGEVRPNTLRDQRAPNTFRAATAPGTPGSRQARNRGGGNMAPLRRISRPQVSIWAYLVVAVLVVLVILYLLQGVP
jgi:hypothetical protein